MFIIKHQNYTNYYDKFTLSNGSNTNPYQYLYPQQIINFGQPPNFPENNPYQHPMIPYCPPLEDNAIKRITEIMGLPLELQELLMAICQVPNDLDLWSIIADYLEQKAIPYHQEFRKRIKVLEEKLAKVED